MAIQRDHTLGSWGGITITGCYHRINSVELRWQSDPVPTGIPDEDLDSYKTEYDFRIDWETFLNSGERYSITGHAHGGDSADAPLSILSGVSGQDSLIAASYDYLKTGVLSGGLDV